MVGDPAIVGDLLVVGLQIQKGLVVGAAQRDLSRPPRPTGDGTAPDEVHRVDDQFGVDRLADASAVERHERLHQFAEGFGPAGKTAETLQFAPSRTDLGIVPVLRQDVVPDVGVEHATDGLGPAGSTILDDVHLAGAPFGRLDVPTPPTAGVEPHADAEHRHVEHPGEGLAELPIDIPSRDESAVVQRRSASLVHEIGSHHPQSPPRRRPLEMKESIVRSAGGLPCSRFVPGELARPTMDALDGRHPLDDASTRLPPGFAVSTVGAPKGDFRECAESPGWWLSSIGLEESVAQLEASVGLDVDHHGVGGGSRGEARRRGRIATLDTGDVRTTPNAPVADGVIPMLGQPFGPCLSGGQTRDRRGSPGTP